MMTLKSNILSVKSNTLLRKWNIRTFVKQVSQFNEIIKQLWTTHISYQQNDMEEKRQNGNQRKDFYILS